MNNQTRVQVFFPKSPEGEPSPDNPFNLTPVSRFANKQTPARGALEALLGNITLEEEGEHLLPLDTAGLSIGVLTISNSEAEVDFFSGGTKKWSGDVAPGAFRLAVEATLKQFPTIKVVRVKVDGDAEFGSLG